MAFRNLFVVNNAYVCTKHEQLLVKTDQEHSFPIEDINAVLLESQQITITTAAMAKLAQYGVALFVCDEKHLPCGVLHSMAQHSRERKWIGLQISQDKPKQKRLWQQIVKAKILNQGRCLTLCDIEGEAKLKAIAREVLSGDTGNAEGVAAGYYFKRLFGKTFTRDQECLQNAALNYGYAIVRGVIARTLAVYGYVPALGLHHRSELNAFNLADDLIEPLRPLVDLYVAKNISEGEGNLTSDIKHGLFGLLNMEMESDGEKHIVSYAADRMVQSLGRCFEGTEKQLVLPELIGLVTHTYD
ncbi:MAG: type II CRISPR-associated endonuclease Cas1 [Oscillospiraceae bacterium]|nr:type II CRISPR-associated endonuclease Cas1 [Oscillospiraceae bacterium]